MLDNIYTIFIITITVIIVVFMAYYATAIIAKKSNVYFQGRCVKVLERTVISTNFSIISVQAIDKVYILALQNKNMVVLDTVDIIKWKEYKDLHSDMGNNQNIMELLKKSSSGIKNSLKPFGIKSNKKGDENNKHDDE